MSTHSSQMHHLSMRLIGVTEAVISLWETLQKILKLDFDCRSTLCVAPFSKVFS